MTYTLLPVNFVSSKQCWLETSQAPENAFAVQKPNRATSAALQQFHTQEYIEFLQTARPDHISDAQISHFNVIDDSPLFEGVFKFCQIYAGASIHGAQELIQHDYDIAINWAGGLHHAKKGEASGMQPYWPTLSSQCQPNSMQPICDSSCTHTHRLQCDRPVCTCIDSFGTEAHVGRIKNFVSCTQ